MSAGDELTATWASFTERLGALGLRLDRDPFPQSDFDRAEGFRHLTRQLVMAVQSEVEHADPQNPSFHRYEEPWVQWGGPNPDNVYQRAAIDPTLTYRVRGNVGGVHSMIVSLVDGDMHMGRYGVFSERTLSDFRIGDDGELELWLSPTAPDADDANWLPMHADARMLLVRQYQCDWERDAVASLAIEALNTAGVAPRPIGTGDLCDALDRAMAWTEASIDFWKQYTARAEANTPRNAFSPPATPPGGAPTIGYGGGWWDLAPDEALIIESDVPDADYWGWTIHTNHWLESGDFAVRQTSLNPAQAHVDSDGRYRVVVAAADPGVPNWIDIEHRPQGMLVYRYVGARTKPVPTASVVLIAAVRDHLPVDHPHIDPPERRALLARRRAALLARYA